MNILIFYRHFPVAMGRYIHWGLQEAGHEVFSVGPYSGPKIPWGPQFSFPKYDWPPDISTPDQNMSIEYVIKAAKSKGFKPDMIIQAADTIHLEGKAPIKNVLIGTDPHAVDYSKARVDADYYVSMQKCYLPNKKLTLKMKWMPYGYFRPVHRWMPQVTIKYHVVFCGLQYSQRTETLQKISNKGYKVVNKLGIIYDEYAKLYNQGMIAFNWSSKDDLPCRFWEGLAMQRCVLTNRVPDLKEFNFEEGVDYLGFDTVDEAVEKADFYLKRPELLFKIANNGYKKVKKHHWTNRVKQMLKDVK